VRLAALRLRVGGLTLAVQAARPGAHLQPPGPYRSFLARSGGDIRLDLVETDPPQGGELLFDSGGIWKVFRQGRGRLYTFETPVLDPPLYKAVAIDARLGRGRLFVPPQRGRLRPRWALAYPLDELLFQHRLAREGGLEIHACGLVVGGSALLFSGQSGAGKSTTAALWRRARAGVRVLSDDRIVIRERGGRFWAFGTPWHGDGMLAAPLARPLRAIFFLRHAPRHELRPLPPAEAASRLFARSFPPPWDGRALARVLATCGRVAGRVPSYDFGFTADESAVSFLRDNVLARLPRDVDRVRVGT
jgi:hypothetical protein